MSRENQRKSTNAATDRVTKQKAQREHHAKAGIMQEKIRKATEAIVQ